MDLVRSEAELLSAARAGDQTAVAALLVLHAPTITAAVVEFCRRWRRWRPDEEDLAQEARILFLAAVATHDPARGSLARFARYMIPLRLVAVLGANSTLRRSRVSLRNHAARWRAGEEVPGWAKEMLSLDEEREGHGARVEELVGSDPGPAVAFERAEVEARVLRHVGELDPLRADVIRRRYLVDEPEEQRVVAEALGVSRSYVGQLEAHALRVVRKRLEREAG